jgi:hypothetical protein
MSPFVSKINRTYYNVVDLEKHDSQHNNPFDPYPNGNEVCLFVPEEQANTIGSLIENSGHLHAPVIDIDWHCLLRSFTDCQELDIWCKQPALNDEQLISYMEELKHYSFIVRGFFSRSIHYRFEIPSDTSMALLPSKSPDHFHLYIDIVITFNEYLRLLVILENLGIVQSGFRAMTQRRGMSHLRKPSADLFIIAD